MFVGKHVTPQQLNFNIINLQLGPIRSLYFSYRTKHFPNTTTYAKKNGSRYKNSKNSKSFQRNLHNSNFDAQGRAESRKIGLVTLQ